MVEFDELSQILEGPANEACSLFDCLKYMPPGGGPDEWRHLPRSLEGQHQLDVFLHRSRPGAVEQRVGDFIRWIEDRSDARNYMWMVNLVQLWVPISASGDGDETILSVSEQPFGVGRLSNGICRYRYASILHKRKTCPSGGDDYLITTAFATRSPCFEHHHHQLYGIQSRWALPLVDPTTEMPLGVLEFVTMNQHHFECHRMLTRSFLDFGPKYYEQYCKDLKGKSVESEQYMEYSSHHHLPTQENMISGTDRSFWQTMYDVSNGLLGNANEVHTNYANGFGMQQNTGRTVNFEIGKDNFSSATMNHVLGNAIDYDLFSSDIYSANGLWSDPVPTQENTRGTDHNFLGATMMNNVASYEPLEDHNYSANWFPPSNVVDPPIWDGVEDEQVAAQENPGGFSNYDIIEDTTQRRSPPAISRKPRKPLYCDQLKQNFGRPLQEVADEYGVHLSTAKRRCRECHIKEWPSSRKRKKPTKKHMIVKAAYGEITVKVWDFDSTKELEWLTIKLGVKLKLHVGSFRIEYQDGSGNLITVSCTEHLMRRLDSLFSENMKNMYLIVSPSN